MKNERTYIKPVTKRLTLVLNGYDATGISYNSESAVAIIKEFTDINLFSKLAVSASMSRALCENNPNAKGAIHVASISQIKDGSVTLTFRGKNTEYAPVLDHNHLIIKPRVRVNSAGDVTVFLGFEIVESEGE